MSKTFMTAVALAATFAFTGVAQAAITIYDNQADFLAAVSAVGVDDYDDLSVSATPGPLARSAGAYGYSVSVGSNSTTFFPGTDDGDDIFLSTNNRFDTITFGGFSPSVSALGGFFFGSDIFGLSTPAASITLSIADAGSEIGYVIAFPTTSSFVGFTTDSAFSSFTVTVGDQVGVWPSVDNLHLGQAGAIPEPATWAMMIGGFGLAGAALRRRQALAAA